jgi:hypothetical protein
MINTPQRGQDLLPEFQKFLLEKKLTPENKASFFAYWVTRYLSFARKQRVSADDHHEDSVAAFLEDLRANPRIKDWQPRQAEDALRLYYFHYLGKAKLEPGGLALSGDSISVTRRFKRLSSLLFKKRASRNMRRSIRSGTVLPHTC